jgi:peptidoglycan/LPS O-acetylase OafA/YrhL
MATPSELRRSRPLEAHVPWLDGLRGIAALWVLVSHVRILTGVRFIDVLLSGDLAVDLFMLLSGFLMAHHYLQRRAREPWEDARTAVKFWLRRLFRIAPLYYVLFAAAIAFGPALGEYRTAIAHIWPLTATPIERYDDQTAANVAAHVTFLFGAIPAYAFRSPLPDWSIGLEMQFYLIFPLLMLAIARSRYSIAAGLGIVALCLATRVTAPEYYALFPAPSFLPMKLGIFIIGMWAAIGRSGPSLLPMLYGSLAVALASAVVEHQPVRHTIVLVVLIVGFYYLMNDGTLPLAAARSKLTLRARALLSGKIAVFLGDTSYGVYLLHLLILIPIAGALAKYPAYVGLPAAARYALCLALTLVPVYAGAWALHRSIEQPGIRAGKNVIAYVRTRRAGKQALERT